MAEDIEKYIHSLNLVSPTIIGHSLGGKVGMNLAFRNNIKFRKLIVVDIAPKKYSVDFHKNILEFLSSISIKEFCSRVQIDDFLSSEIKDFSDRQFLMKNLYRDTKKEFNWRFNIMVLKEKLYNISGVDFLDKKINIPTLFLSGERSNYINEDDKQLISNYFVNYQIYTIANSGHWIHAEQPELFYNSVISFIN